MTAPNVLLVVLDATRKDHLSAYGYDRPTTPALEELADEGTRYEQAITPSPWTPPSHASMFTGRYPSGHGVYNSQLSLEYDGPTLAELLSDAGYTTLGFSNSYHTSTERNFHRGFDYYHDIFELPRFLGTMYEPSLDFLRYVPNYLFRNYDHSYFQTRRLETKLDGTDEPFFAFINLNSAHSPYDPPRRYREQFESHFDKWETVDEEAAHDYSEGDGKAYTVGGETLSETEYELLKCWYDGEIRFMDDLLSGLFDFLRAREAYENTLMIVVADHGELFGEDGLGFHSFSLHEVLLNVPLIVRWPEGVDDHVDRSVPSPGSVSEKLVSTIDIAPTVCEWAGVDVPERMDGYSLTTETGHDHVFAEYDRPQPPERDRLLREYADFKSHDRGLQAIRTADFKLVREIPGEKTLYRVGSLTETPVDDPDTERRLSKTLDDGVDELPDVSHEEDLPDHVEEHLEKMGYR
jgi:arylsulfatase A-like enzyme